MSYRYTDIRKWREPWFRKMAPEEKLAYFYLWEGCDNAGFIPFDSEAASFQMGLPLKRLPKIWPKLKDRIIIVDEWVWIKDFPVLQKNWPLNPKNGAHIQIARLLGEQCERFKNSPDFRPFIGPAEGLLCPLGKGNGQGNGLGIGLGIDLGNGLSNGNGNGRGEGNGQGLGLEHVNRELQECAVATAEFTNEPPASDDGNPFQFGCLRRQMPKARQSGAIGVD